MNEPIELPVISLIFFCIGFAIATGVGIIASRAAYQDGIVEGYNYAKHPEDGHYSYAREHIRQVQTEPLPKCTPKQYGECADCRYSKCGTDCLCVCHWKK